MPQGYLRSLHSIGAPDGMILNMGKIKITRSKRNQLTVDIFDVAGRIVYAIPAFEIFTGDSLTLVMPTTDAAGADS